MCIIKHSDLLERDIVSTVINSRKIQLNYNTIVDKTVRIDKYNKTHIIELKTKDLVISLASKIKIDDTVYRCNFIEEIDDSKFEIVEDRMNLTSIFILPYLDYSLKGKAFYGVDEYMVNSFLFTENESKDSNLFVLYRFSQDEKYINTERNILSNPYFKKCIEVTPYHTLFEFYIPDINKDINNFIKGKYSQLSDKLREKILDFHGFNKNGNTYKILTKCKKFKKELEEELRCKIPDDIDLFSKPDIGKEETFILKYYF